jgi:hypothetical protein
VNIPGYFLTLSVRVVKLGTTSMYSSKHLGKFISQRSIETLQAVTNDITTALGALPKEVKTEKMNAIFIPVATVDSAWSTVLVNYLRAFYRVSMIMEVIIRGMWR